MDINKDLMAASSTPIVLAILAEGDSYGYAIIKRVQELSGGRMAWSDGMLYPVLHRLERLGHVVARWEVAESGRRRKYYRITTQGRAQLVEERRQWQAVDATLRGLWSATSPFRLFREECYCSSAASITLILQTAYRNSCRRFTFKAPGWRLQAPLMALAGR